jgi:hypothetical protein
MDEGEMDYKSMAKRCELQIRTSALRAFSAYLEEPGKSYSFTPIDHLMDAKVKDKTYQKQILF